MSVIQSANYVLLYFNSSNNSISYVFTKFFNLRRTIISVVVITNVNKVQYIVHSHLFMKKAKNKRVASGLKRNSTLLDVKKLSKLICTDLYSY